MHSSPLDHAIRHLRRLTGMPVDRADGELLERFIAQRDEAAFEALVQRHGRMVLGVCRSFLHNAADAEDAFQATFLVLVRCAASVRKRSSLSSWLYGVAYRTSLRVRSAAARQRSREKQVAAMSPTDSNDKAADSQDLRPVMTEEVNRLPEKYRAPLVLCYLEGKTTDETAQELGWPRGTVSIRLTRGRDLLRTRLSRRGVTLSAAALTTILGQEVVSAAVPAGLSNATVQAALLFAAGQTAAGGASASVLAVVAGVHRAMWWHKVRIAAALLLALGLGAFGSVLSYRAYAAKPVTVAEDAADQAATPKVSEELTEKTLARWQAYILPRQFEIDWQQIPWRPTFWEGMVEAQAKDRPILLWTMNGHPCGET
jgi:RNA polymerase sigma factor (sigma-70 family)